MEANSLAILHWQISLVRVLVSPASGEGMLHHCKYQSQITGVVMKSVFLSFVFFEVTSRIAFRSACFSLCLWFADLTIPSICLAQAPTDSRHMETYFWNIPPLSSGFSVPTARPPPKPACHPHLLSLDMVCAYSVFFLLSS